MYYFIKGIHKMLGREYFERRLSELFELSPIEYENGNGLLKSQNKEIQVDWELNVSITGDTLLILSSDDIIHEAFSDKTPIEWTLIGENQNGFKLEAKKVYIFNPSIGNKHNNRQASYHCSAETIDIIKKDIDEINQIHAFVHNFYFFGRNFTINTANRKIEFLLLNKEKELYDMIKNARIDKAFFSVVLMPRLDKEKLDEAINILDNISALLCLFSMNMTIAPLLKLYKNDELIGYKIRKLKLFPYIRFREIIDNFKIREGIKFAIESCYDKFIEIEKLLNLKTLINGLVAMMIQPYLDLKIAILLVSYEFLLSKYLKNEGLKEVEIINLSIQDKLRRINKYLKFIPSRLLKDNLRANIRNSLFHQGELVFLKSDEIFEVYSTYWELIIQIILKILNYKGKYLEPFSNQVKVSP